MFIMLTLHFIKSALMMRRERVTLLMMAAFYAYVVDAYYALSVDDADVCRLTTFDFERFDAMSAR